MPWLLALLLVTTVLATAPLPEPTIEPPLPPGTVQGPVQMAEPAQEPGARWYGAPGLAVDGAVIVAAVAAVEMHDPDTRIPLPVVYGLMGAYLVGGPLAHLVHGKPVHSLESLLLRAGTLAAALAVGQYTLEAAGCNNDSFPKASTCDWAAWGMVLSPVAAMLVDDLLLAREPVARPSAASLSTRLVVQPGLALVGLGGSF